MPGEVALVLHELVEELSDLSPDDPDAVDRLTKLNVAFHVEVMRMSKITELASLARVVVPISCSAALRQRILLTMPRRLCSAQADRQCDQRKVSERCPRCDA